jgi:hypothetical protein
VARRYSYVGLLDDFAARNSDTAITTVSELNERLVLAVLFSDPLLINDGYVLQHAAVKTALIDPKASPLKALVEAGFVKILSRNANQLGSLAHVMADANISSAQDLLRSADFTKTYQPLLARWSAELSSDAFDAFLPWPNLHIDKIFRSVAAQVTSADSFAGVLHQIASKDFLDRLADTSGRRTEWENIGKELVTARTISPAEFKKLMWAANEIYQYAWGCALTVGLGSARVLTRVPKHLRELEASELTLTEKPKNKVELLLPNRVFVVKAVAGKWERLTALVAPGHELNRHKHKFLDSLRAYYGTAETSSKQVSGDAKQYTLALSKHFGGQTAVPVVFDLSFVGLSTAAGFYAGAAAGPAGAVAGAAAGAAVGAVGVAATHLGVPKLLWRLSAPSPKEWLVHNRAAAPDGVTSCFAIDISCAKTHTEGAQRP